METGTDNSAEPALQHRRHIEGSSSVLTPDFYAPISQIVNDPALQHKRHLEGNPTSLCTDFFASPAETPEFQLSEQQNKCISHVGYTGTLSYSDASPKKQQTKIEAMKNNSLKDNLTD